MPYKRRIQPDPFVFKPNGKGKTIDLYPVLMQGDWSTYEELITKLNCDVTHKTLRSWLKKLWEEGLIVIRSDFADMRLKVIDLTPKAKALRSGEGGAV